MSDFPRMGQKLFVPNGHPDEYSHIAWGNMYTQFYGYMMGYKEAADVIIRITLDSDDTSKLDTLVYPICFLYRHYIEIALKNIYLTNTKDTEEEKIQTLKSCQHNLLMVWHKVKPLIIADFPDDDATILDAVEDYIKQFCVADNSSFAFRYPINKELNFVNHREKYINLANLAERMDELASFLSAVCTEMSSHRDYEHEMMHYYTMEMDGYY
jgi:hypothetical protein